MRTVLATAFLLAAIFVPSASAHYPLCYWNGYYWVCHTHVTCTYWMGIKICR